MPAAEVRIDVDLVRGLLADQHSDLAQLELVALPGGWDNEIYRLGDVWLVRLPRREIAVQNVRNEQRWLPELAPRLPLPIPVPERIGTAGRGYPWPWSLCRWLEGETADEAPLDFERAAQDMGQFLRALHAPAPPDAPANEFRGVPLISRDSVLHERLLALGDTIDTAAVQSVWSDALEAPGHRGPPIWLHGDLHPANLLVRNQRLSAVLDFGDVSGGDPACDLAVAWMLLPPVHHPSFREAAGNPEDSSWRRARGWALSHGLACLATSADNPRMHRIGAQTLARVLADL
jgi:aminoglycoside phosphotransferase (APT) family kinase protein